MAGESEKIVPAVCPFCFAEGPERRGKRYSWIACANQGCRAEGPMCDTEEEAVARWNAVPRNRPKADALQDLLRAGAVAEADPRVHIPNTAWAGAFRDRDLPGVTARLPDGSPAAIEVPWQGEMVKVWPPEAPGIKGPQAADTPLLPLLSVYANRDGLCHTVLAGSAEDRIALGLEYNLVGHLLLVNEGTARG